MPLRQDLLRIPVEERKFDRATVDSHASRLLHNRDSKLQAWLSNATRTCEDAGLPDWISTASQGRIFQLQCRMVRARRVLEVGTLGGHGTLWCASVDDEVHITTIECVEEFVEVARKNFRAAGIEERVELIHGRADEVLHKLSHDTAVETRPLYDLAIVDTDGMEGLWELFEKTVTLCRSGACILTHCAVSPSNMSLAPEEEPNPRVKGSRLFLEQVAMDDRTDTGLIMCSGEQEYDLLVAVVR